MFYIRKNSIKYYKTERGTSFTAHLLQSSTDVHMGVVKNTGCGRATSLMCSTPHVDKMVQSVADHFNIEVPALMEFYMDIAEGFFESHSKPLAMAIADYRPE